MFFPRSLCTFLLCSTAYFTSPVLAFPSNGELTLPNEILAVLENNKELGLNGDIERNLNLTSLELEKRGIFSCFKSLCCFSNNRWVCENNWPPLDSLKKKIADYGNVGNKRSFFYTGLGGGGAIQMAGQWANCHTNYVPNPPGFVLFDQIVDPKWMLKQSAALFKLFNGNIDPFQKLLSQAFAEQSSGDVYVFAPTGQDLVNTPNNLRTDQIAWYGWEYPALTRNTNVGNIYRVDPRQGQDNDRHLLWSQGQGPSANAPLGLYNAPAPPPQP